MKVKEVISQLQEITLRDFKSCFQEKWYWCHMNYCICSFDESRKNWKYLPICQESCKSYENQSRCKKILLHLNTIIKSLVKYCEFVELLVSMNCAICPNYKVGSKNCIYNIAGKCFVFHEKALFLRGLFPSQKPTKMFRLVVLSFSWKIKLGGKWKNG